MGNQAFTRWADGPGSRAGVAVPPLSAHEAWGPILAREPTAPAAESESAESEEEDDTEEPIEVKGMQFGKSVLDGVIPAAGGDLTKTFTTNFDKKADFGPYSMMVPLMPPFVTAKFGAAGAMGAKANASLTLTGTNIADAAFGQAKKQQVTASGKGDRRRHDRRQPGRGRDAGRSGPVEHGHLRPGHARAERGRRRQLRRLDQAPEAQEGRRVVGPVDRAT